MWEQVINTALNKILALDPEVPEKLNAFSGKVIQIHLTIIEKDLFLVPEGDRIQVHTSYDGEVNTCISGSPMAIMKMMVKPDVATMLLSGEVEITGDTRPGNALKKLFREMELDWQQPVSGIIGDAATQQLETGTKKFNTWGRKALSSFNSSVSEYLQEESRDIVTGTELEIFNQQVDDLRDDTERLQARLTAILKQ